MRMLLIGLGLLALAGCAARVVPVPEPEPTGDVLFASAAGEQGRGHLDAPQRAGKPRPGVVVLPDDYGLDASILANAARISRMGYVVLTVDLYRGEKVDGLLDAHIMDRLPEERVMADVKGAVDYLLSRRDVAAGPVAIVGWGTGGGYALDAAAVEGRLSAVVTCYGRLTTDANALRPMRASVLALHAAADEGNPPENRAAFKQAMDAAGKRLVGQRVFARTRRGFLNPRPEHELTPSERDARRDAWAMIEEYLKAELP